MSTTNIRNTSETRATTTVLNPNAARSEPSHIHIQRPSRRVRPSLTLAPEPTPILVEPELSLHDAA
jgi:hypothetical protein